MERTVRRSLLFLFSAALGFLGWADPAPASSFRMVDKDGVVHLTNAPTNSHYRPQPGWSGTASGWLAIPEAVAILRSWLMASFPARRHERNDRN